MVESVTSNYPLSNCEVKDDVWTFLTVLGKGIMFEYVIPNLLVIRASLSEVKLQWVNCEGEVEVFDGFAHRPNSACYPQDTV